MDIKKLWAKCITLKTEIHYFVIPERRSRAYGLFYTIGIGCGAAFPPFFGLLSDWTGVRIAFVVLTGVVALTIPLAGILRGSLREKR